MLPTRPGWILLMRKKFERSEQALGAIPLFDRHEFAVRADGHVTASQNAGQRVQRRIELQAQDVGKSAFAGFDDGAGVMGDQPAQHGVGVLGVAQVTGAVQGVQARHGQAGGVADVVQPRGGFQEAGVGARTGARLRARAATPWTCAQRRGGVPGGVPGRDVRPVKPARSCGQG
jgi:hypothetical protein